jgi:hypothetical protein
MRTFPANSASEVGIFEVTLMEDHELKMERYKENQAFVSVVNGWLKMILMIAAIAVLIFMYFNTSTKLDENQRQLREMRMQVETIQKKLKIDE